MLSTSCSWNSMKILKAIRSQHENILQFLVFYYGSHIVRKFDKRSFRASFWMTVCECQHTISGSFNHFIEYGRWGSAHIDSLSIPAIQRNDFVVQIILRGATRTWNLWRIDRELFSARLKPPVCSWSLRWLCTKPYIFNDAGRHPPSSIILSSTLRTLLNITWQWKLLPTNGHRLLLRSSSAINFAPQGFSKFFPIFHDNFDFTHTPRGCLWHGIQNMLLVGSYSAGVYETAYLDYFTAVTM